MVEKPSLPKHFGFYPDLLGFFFFFLSYYFVALIIEPRACPVLCRGSTAELVSSLLPLNFYLFTYEHIVSWFVCGGQRMINKSQFVSPCVSRGMNWGCRLGDKLLYTLNHIQTPCVCGFFFFNYF